ncbi:hypothetical protein DRO97_01860 [Archaeoglobales archaeon]|nr:MAG: hypothetical protein DRO97_01860 [Archaeoglobales archaeon]
MATLNRIAELEAKVLDVLVQCDFLPSSATHSRIAGDIYNLGLQKVLYLADNFSPSQLGRMGYLGCRWLAIAKRDHPNKYQKIIQKLVRL